MKILLIGSGGREDALAWGLSRSPRSELLRCAPGNAGIAERAEIVHLAANDIDAIVDHAHGEGYDLVVVGPEAPLVAGLADRLRATGIPVFGPSAAAACIEGSKVFAKKFMEHHGIPSGRCEIFDDLAGAERFLESREAVFPTVIKADGLAAGKGVLLADDREAALQAARAMLGEGRFGEAGSRILVEEMLYGREVSVFVLSDGEAIVELPTCQDYKRALDGDGGLNTGGMGCYSPSAYLDDATRQKIVNEIIRPTIEGLATEERPYNGVLYCGLMLTDSGPKVLEFNARFGDPETQVLIPRLEGDWAEVLHACATGDLAATPLEFKQDAAVCVVMASGGYPAGYAKGLPIEGLEAVASMDDVMVFHAGTARDDAGALATAGGRVLGVTGMGPDLETARARAYDAVSRIRWDGEHHRNDIAADAVRRLAGSND